MKCREARRLLVTEEAVAYRAGRLARHLDRCGVCREEAARVVTETKLIRLAFANLRIREDFADEVFRLVDSDRATRRSRST